MNIAIIIVIALIILIIIIKDKFEENKRINARRDFFLHYVNIPAVNYFNISRDQVINNPRSIWAIKKFTDFDFLSDYKSGSYYYPQDTENADIYLLSYNLIRSLESYKKLCDGYLSPDKMYYMNSREFFNNIEYFHLARDLIDDIKVQHMQSHAARHSKDIPKGIPLKSYRSIHRYITNRDNNKCVLCGDRSDNSDLDVHHITYRAHGGDNHPKNLVSLCKVCHASLSQHGLVLNKTSATAEYNCHRINRSKIISNIQSSDPDIISNYMYDKLFSKNPLLNILDESHFRYSKDSLFRRLY